MRKHRQGSNFQKIPCPRAPHRCQDFRNFGEIWSLPMFSHFRLQEFWGNSSLATFCQPHMRKHRQRLQMSLIPCPRIPHRCQELICYCVIVSSIFAVNLNIYICSWWYYYIGSVVIISSSAAGGGIHVVPITYCYCCSLNCSSTSSGIIVFSSCSCCIDVADFDS